MNTTTEKKKYHFRDFTTEYEEYNLTQSFTSMGLWAIPGRAELKP